MKKNVLTWFSAALMCAALMFSCEDPENVVHVTSITLTPQTLNLTAGETHQLVATVKPEEATYKQVIWSSSNSSVASVPNVMSVPEAVANEMIAGKATVTAVSAGTATITAMSFDGELTSTCQVTVTDNAPAKSVVLGNQNGTIDPGKANQQATFAVTTTGIPAGSKLQEVLWFDETGTNQVDKPTVLNFYLTALQTFTVTQLEPIRQDIHLKFLIVIDGVQSNKADLIIKSIITKSVTVESQVGTLLAGVAGSVTFPVRTTNIANGNYVASVTNLPTGVAVSGNVTIANNAGTLTLSGNAQTVAGATSTLRLTIDGTQSNAFTLTVSPANTKSILLGNQNGTIDPHKSNQQVTYAVTTTGIPAGSKLQEVLWFDETGTNQVDKPTVLKFDLTNLQTFTVTQLEPIRQDIHLKFLIVIDGVQSNKTDLIIGATTAKSVTVESQAGTLLAGVAGTVTFPVKTTGIANGNYVASVANLPTGVAPSASVNLVITNGAGTLTLAGNTQTVAGVTSTLRLTIDGTQSNAFTLTVSPAGAKSVTVDSQVGALVAGTAGTATFAVGTTNIATNMTGQVIWVDELGNPKAAPGGVNTSITTGNANRTLTVTITTSAQSNRNFFFVEIDGTRSNMGTLLIDNKLTKIVTVESQAGTLSEGTAGQATFAVRTENIATNMTGQVTWVDAQGNPKAAPGGVNTSVTTGNVNRTLTVTTTTNAQFGQYYFHVQIDGTHSNMGTLTIEAKQIVKSVTVEGQVGELVAGVPGDVTFPVKTTNIANGTYEVSVGNIPLGVSASRNITITNGNGTLTFTSTKNTVSGVTSNLRLTIDGIQSNAFTLTVVSCVKSIIVKDEQENEITVGIEGKTFYDVSTSCIPTSGECKILWYNSPRGGATTSAPQGFVQHELPPGSAERKLILAFSPSTVAGKYYFAISMEDMISNIVTLEIKAPTKSIELGPQKGVLEANKPGVATFEVKTTGISPAIKDFEVSWYNEAGTIIKRPAWVVWTDPDRILTNGSEKRTLTIETTSSAAQCNYKILISIDGVQSNKSDFVVTLK